MSDARHTPAEPSKESGLEKLPKDVFAIILGYSKNPSVLFNVNKNIRKKVNDIMHVANTSPLLTFEKGEACYVVYKYLKEYPTKAQLKSACTSLTKPDSIKLAAMVPAHKVKRNVVYLEQAENGSIKYFTFTENYINYTDYFIRHRYPAFGVITPAALPLLECVQHQRFDPKNHEHLKERIVAIIRARGFLPNTQWSPTANIFKHRKDAETFAAANGRRGPITYAIVHECTVKDRIVLACTKRLLLDLNGAIKPVWLPMASILRSNLLLAARSYPCNFRGEPVEIIESENNSTQRRCSVM